MGRFLNPNDNIFRSEANADIYVDKTGLIEFTNHACNTPDRFICSSRPRRFGKSYAADMLTAYYSKGSHSRELFAHYQIGRMEDFDLYLNKCDVIRFDVQWCRSAAGSAENTVPYINECILKELREEYQETNLTEVNTVFDAMSHLNMQSGKVFVVIIDEWDALIRDDAGDQKVQEEYINFLRGMFKGTEPLNYIMLAYMTGILPIRRMKTQSSLNNFREYTMVSSGPMAPYIGFTEQEVQELCTEHNMDYGEIRRWYDGYLLKDLQIYNPNSVCQCISRMEAGDYWTTTASFESIRPYINIDFQGLKTFLIEMLSGARTKVNVTTFENHTDRSAFRSRDDVFTYMIHLGYLAYDQVRKEAFVPNEEIRQELGAEIKESGWNEFLSFEKESSELLTATIEGDGNIVADKIERIHDRYASAIWYNNENSLAAVIEIGYLATLEYYFKPIRELPAGKGFADLVYLPRPEFLSDVPALVVELKWNKNTRTAIDQIRQKQYPESIHDYTGNILLVGINYDKTTKAHTCIIETFERAELC